MGIGRGEITNGAIYVQYNRQQHHHVQFMQVVEHHKRIWDFISAACSASTRRRSTMHDPVSTEIGLECGSGPSQNRRHYTLQTGAGVNRFSEADPSHLSPLSIHPPYASSKSNPVDGLNLKSRLATLNKENKIVAIPTFVYGDGGITQRPSSVIQQVAHLSRIHLVVHGSNRRPIRVIYILVGCNGRLLLLVAVPVAVAFS
ncbi:hypothetical protein M413DRAFT_186708 [Hebeloma cylindrosporum]|uniref:Uncharacterized protein n=1 Tax=Hebeloma cylindrosporum TaxID=76867 RepID=A0A0C3C8F9_HEBCY|nr:hypothetical protein M413DRAFT_186708 [Hebeloma cylindrosporum h7]